MVARPGAYQASLNGGELAPEVSGNTGLKQYYVGASRMLNAEPVPQGGFDGASGTRLRGRVRRALTSAWTHGADSAAGVAAAGAVFTYSLGATLTIAAVDVTGLAASVAQSAALLVVELQTTGGGWVTLGGGLPLPLSASAATRRLARAPGAGLAATAVRLRLTAAPSASITLGHDGLTLWSEASSGIMEHRVRPFVVDRDAAYVAVMTPDNVDFWTSPGGVFAGAAALPYAADQLPTLDVRQRGESAFLFDQDMQTRRILRHGADWSWSIGALGFDNLPQVDYGGAYTQVAEQWVVNLRWTSLAIAGQVFTLSVDGISTSAITIAATWAATVPLITAALEALSNVAAGVTVTLGTAGTGTSDAATFTVAFTGTGNIGNTYDVSGSFVSSSNGSLTTWRTVEGDAGGEDVVSTARGWAGCGLFYQDRLWQGGLKAKPGAFMGSRTAEYFDYNIKLDTASAAFLVAIDMEGGDRIVRLAEGRHLLMFATGGNWFLPNRTSSTQDVLAPVKNSSDTCSPRVPIVEQEGSLLFVNEAETIVFASQYDEVRQGYVPEPLSLLSSHLINGIRDAALLPASTATDADRLFLPRDDGLMVVGVLIRNQDVAAFVRRVTDGSFRAVAAVARETLWLTVERQVGGVPTLMLETLEPNQLFDAAISSTSEADRAVIDGLGEHEGATVWADVDGYIDGPFVVASASITLNFPGKVATVGRWIAPDVETMPLPRDVAERQVLARPGRIHTVRADVIGTKSLSIGANGRPPRPVTLARPGQPTDAPLPPYTGPVVVTGLMGFTEAPTARFTQGRPGRLQVRNITLEARL